MKIRDVIPEMGGANLANQRKGQLFVQILNAKTQEINRDTHFHLVNSIFGPPLDQGKSQFVGMYGSAKETLSQRNRIWNKLLGTSPTPKYSWNGDFNNPGSDRAFLILCFVDTDPKSKHPPIVWGSWSSSWNQTKNELKTTSAMRSQMGLRQMNKNSFQLKPSQVLSDDSTPMSEKQLMTVIQSSRIPTVVKKLTDQFSKTSTYPWVIPAGTFQNTAQDKALFDSIMVDYSEILHPLGLTKSTPLKYDGIQNIRDVSSKIFGSPTRYENADIVFSDKNLSEAAGESSMTALYDSILIDPESGRKIMISSKRGEGAAPNLSAALDQYLDPSFPEDAKRFIQKKIPERTIKVFNILGGALTTDSNGNSSRGVTHYFDAARELGILTSNEEKAAKSIWNEVSETDISRHKTLQRISNSNNITDQSRLNMMYGIIKEVGETIRTDNSFSDLIRLILENVGFVQIFTLSSKFDPTKDMTVRFDIIKPNMPEVKIVFNWSPVAKEIIDTSLKGGSMKPSMRMSFKLAKSKK